MPSPMESIMAMFLMSLTSFGDYYTAFERTDHEIEAKVHTIDIIHDFNCTLILIMIVFFSFYLLCIW